METRTDPTTPELPVEPPATRITCPDCGGSGGTMIAPGYCDGFDICDTCEGLTTIPAPADATA